MIKDADERGLTQMQRAADVIFAMIKMGLIDVE